MGSCPFPSYHFGNSPLSEGVHLYIRLTRQKSDKNSALSVNYITYPKKLKGISGIFFRFSPIFGNFNKKGSPNTQGVFNFINNFILIAEVSC